MLCDLVLFRHGKAVRPDAAPDDFQRALTERGHQEAATQARRLADAGFVADIALVSSAVRATETWDEAARYFPVAEKRITRSLYLAAPETYRAAAETCGGTAVIVIAHDPGLHDLSCTLLMDDRDGARSREGRALLDHMPTAGIAWFSRANGSANWKLKAHFRPDNL